MRTESSGTWCVPVTYAGRTILNALVGVTAGKGNFTGTEGGPLDLIPEVRARQIGADAGDPVVSARLRHVIAGRGPEVIAWELRRASGATFYLVSGYPGSGPGGASLRGRRGAAPLIPKSAT